jgi:hypothetical protein
MEEKRGKNMKQGEKPPYDKSKQHLTPEEKKAIRVATLNFLKYLFEKEEIQGNFSVPTYHANLGKMKIEMWIDPRDAHKIFRLEEEGGRPA